MFKLLGILIVISLLALPLVACAKTPTLTVSQPMDGATVTESAVTVEGYVSDAKATVTVNDVEVSVAGDGYFNTEVALTEGENTIDVVATRGNKVATTTLTVTYAPLPALSLEITSPEDGATVTESLVIVSGTVSDPEATITVNDVEVEVAEDGTFSADVELTEGENTITVVATLGEETLTKIIIVTYTPLPALSLEITSPEDGATVIESLVIVSGTVSDPEATITVNDVEVEVAEDGTFSQPASWRVSSGVFYEGADRT